MYVRGEIDASARPHCGKSPNLINTPLMNTSGNFTIVDIIITVDVILVGVEENISPMAEKQNEASIIATASVNGCVIVTPSAIPNNIGTRDIPIPNSTDAKISPRRIVVMDTGEDASRSRFLVCVSVGAITGVIDVDVKNIVMPSNPAIRKSTGRSLPIMNATKRNAGKRTPNIITGPFK